MNYDVNYFIEKFEAIPDEQWIMGKFVNSKDQRCALGHCLKPSNTLNHSNEFFDLTTIFSDNGLIVTHVNDNENNSIIGNTPKERILNALKLIKEKEGK